MERENTRRAISTSADAEGRGSTERFVAFPGCRRFRVGAHPT